MSFSKQPSVQMPQLKSTPQLKSPDRFGPNAGPGLYADVPEQEYHDHPALSRSILAEAARYSPMHAHHKWQSDEEGSSDAASLGTALHARVLEPSVFESKYDVAADQCEATKGDGDQCSYSAKYRHDGTWYCGTHAPDGEPDDIEVLKADHAEAVSAMAEALEGDPDTSRLLFGLPGHSEVTILFDDPGTGIRCRARIDRIVELHDGVALVDVKSTRSAHPSDFQRKMGKYGYWLQYPFYTLAAQETGLKVRDFVYACVESEPPYAVQCYRPHPQDKQVMQRRCGELISTVAEAEEGGQYGGYADGIKRLSLKSYQKKRLGIT